MCKTTILHHVSEKSYIGDNCMKFASDAFNIFQHTWSMLLHYLGNFKFVKYCDRETKTSYSM